MRLRLRLKKQLLLQFVLLWSCSKQNPGRCVQRRQSIHRLLRDIYVECTIVERRHPITRQGHHTGKTTHPSHPPPCRCVRQGAIYPAGILAASPPHYKYCSFGCISLGVSLCQEPFARKLRYVRSSSYQSDDANIIVSSVNADADAHHGARKKTSTGRSSSRTSASKVSSVISGAQLLASMLSPPPRDLRNDAG